MTNRNLQKNNQKGFVNIFLLLGIILVAGISYFAWLKQQTDTSGWETYTNADHGFEFKYPALKETKVEEETAVGGKFVNTVYAVSISNNMHRDFSSTPTYKFNDGGFIIIANVGDFSFSPCTYRGEFSSVIGEVKKITVQGIEFERSEGPHQVNFCGVKNDITYGVSIGSDSEPSNFADKIFSTFRFVEPKQSADTSRWKTYENDKYSFEIKLPEEWINDSSRGCTLEYCLTFRLKNDKDPKITILVYNSTYSKVKETILVEQPKLDVKENSFKVNDISWTRLILKDMNGISRLSYYTEKQNKTYEIWISPREEAISTSILSTFKFTK